jgi:pyruvate kinase
MLGVPACAAILTVMMTLIPPEVYTHERVAEQLSDIGQEMINAEHAYAQLLSALHPNFRLSGTNLIHYLILRSKEIREAQEYLHQVGLSSLTNSESHTLHQVRNVLSWLSMGNPVAGADHGCDFETARRLRQANAERLLGIFPVQDRPHIMVTFSAEMMVESMLVEQMLNEGMSVARINCAHDSEEEWLKMIQVLRKAEFKTGKTCKVYMDLAGPKIRIRSIVDAKRNRLNKLPVTEGTELVLRYRASSRGEKGKRDTLYVEPKEILYGVKVGEPIVFDDGKFEATVLKVDPGSVTVKIVRISTKNPVLKPEKGINLPNSDLQIAALTAEDLRNIPFVCKYADMVGYSFVVGPDDVEVLRAELDKYGAGRKPAIILKIERLAAIQNLPALLLNGMKDESLGVMIARGDLAVEIGFERLSEIQEEILWICEAAHVPVIWATQVLETLNKTGYATRSEITDAAMGGRSECVMLNKGPYIVKAISTLEDILTRQMGHIHKKRYIMRPLNIARKFLDKS